MKAAAVSLCLLLAIVPASYVRAGITEGGGTGILDVDTPETLPAGRLTLSLAPRYGYLDASESRLHTFVGNAGLTLGLSSGFEASAVLPFHALFRTDTNAGAGSLFEEDFSFRARDIELKLRKAFPMAGERFRFAVEAVGTAPTGSDRIESVYAPGDSLKPFTTDTWNYGALALTSLDFTGPTGNAPVRLHLNAGYYLNRKENEYRYRTAFRYPLPLPPPTDSKDNDLLLLGAGLEFPLGRLSAFTELVTEQFVNRRDLMDFKENPITLNGGMRFLFPGGVGLTTGLSLNLSGDDGDTAFDPSKIYPDWEARAALSFGDILQSRRQRLEKRRPEAATVTDEVRTDTVYVSVPSAAEVPEAESTSSAPTSASREPVGVTKVPSSALSDTASSTADVAAQAPLQRAVSGTGPESVSGPPEGVTAPHPRPAERDDRDGDGIPDGQDRCPRLAEDWDGYRDLDGCPDLDNDLDGILDVDDLCPNSPEDFLAPNPTDGCPSPFRAWEAGAPPAVTGSDRGTPKSLPLGGPDRSPQAPASNAVPNGSVSGFPDADGDGIPDADDRCPLRAEDFDGFEDEDGCPDLDNDGDGILDAIDDCPNAPETWNGRDDQDGCPDAIPPRRESGSPSTIVVPGGEGTTPTAEQTRLTRELADLVAAMKVTQTSGGKVDPTADWDGDGVGDLYDRCPEIKEDIDGWQDEDGCPDLDNDGDGIPDARDSCPNRAETFNGFEDEDGCPDGVPAASAGEPAAGGSGESGGHDSVPETKPAPQAVADTGRAVPGPEPEPDAATPVAAETPPRPRLLCTVGFETGGSVLDAADRKALDAVVPQLLESSRSIDVVGHSDSRGTDDVNLALSEERARRVLDYLVRAGIPPHRLRSSARGEADPVADNGTPEGRARNRRVEVILLPDGGEGR